MNKSDTFRPALRSALPLTQDDPAPPAGGRWDEQERIAALEREIDLLHQANEILKTARAGFTHTPGMPQGKS